MHIRLHHLIVFSFFLLVSVSLSGCGGGDSGGTGPDPSPDLQISSVQPDSGTVGTNVTIKGRGFSTTASENIVKFDGTEAKVESASSGQIKTVVPSGASSGVVTVSTAGNTASGPTFTVTHAKPVIQSISPKQGPAGTKITIQGDHFSSTASRDTVLFGKTYAPVTDAAVDQLVTEVPEGMTTGEVPIKVTTHGKTAQAPSLFDVKPPEPVIDSVSPGEAKIGMELTITGQHFSSTAGENAVHFDQVTTTPKSATQTELVVDVPGDLVPSSTPYHLAVEVTGRGTSDPTPFTVIATRIDSITPPKGPTGTKVTIKGSHFSDQPYSNRVKFGGYKATLDTYSKTELVAEVPSGLSVGDRVPVSVKTTYGEAATAPDKFEVTSEPFLVLSPTSGPVGSEVTIQEKYFPFSSTASENMVHFGNVQATVKSATSKELVAEVPEGLSAGRYVVKVTVNGNTASSSGFFNVETPSPMVNSMSPQEGAISTEVTFSGENFIPTASDNTVMFGSREATVQSATETELEALVPDGLNPGDYTVTVQARNSNPVSVADPFSVVSSRTHPSFPITGNDAFDISYSEGGFCNNCDTDVLDVNNIINTDESDYATLQFPSQGTMKINVSSSSTIASGGYAGFTIDLNKVVDKSKLLSHIAVDTYYNGQLQQGRSGPDLSLLYKNNNLFISFKTAKKFDQIQLLMQNPLGDTPITYKVYTAYGGRRVE